MFSWMETEINKEEVQNCSSLILLFFFFISKQPGILKLYSVALGPFAPADFIYFFFFYFLAQNTIVGTGRAGLISKSSLCSHMQHLYASQIYILFFIIFTHSVKEAFI